MTNDDGETTGSRAGATDSVATVVSVDGAASLDGSSSTLLIDSELVGARLLHFRIVERLGQGGMGIVYKAIDEKLRRPIALKVLSRGPFTDDTRRSMLLREARSAAGLTHPGIAAVYDIHETRGIAFIAMELVDGETLRVRLARGEIAIPELARWGIEIARGLGSAHRSRVVHRDLKSENVMVTPDGHAKILDFGLAKPLAAVADDVAGDDGAPSSGFASRAGRVIGTPSFMSPEQARGESVDERSDVFSLGVMLYELAAGAVPFVAREQQREPRAWGGEGSKDWARAALADAAPRLPAPFAAIVDRCLSFEPDHRFANGDEVADALEAAADALGLLRGANTTRAPARPYRARVLFAALGCGAIAAVVASGLLRRTRAPHPGAPPPPPSSTPVVAVPASDFAITSAPLQLTNLGDCARAPVLDDDGSVVFGVHDGEHAGIYRLDPNAPPRPLVEGTGRFMNPHRADQAASFS